MAVKIRMKRMGSKKRPFYRVVVADSRAPRDGRFIEELGYYNPIDKDKTFSINAERVAYWMGTGAKPSETVEKLLKKNGILEGKTVKFEAKEEKEVEEQKGAVKPEESTHEDKVDPEQVVEDQKESDVADASVGGPIDPEEVSKEADFPNPDPTTTEVIEQPGDKTDAEEIVEEDKNY